MRAGVFYIFPNEVRANVHLYLIPSIISEEERINEKTLVLEWIKKNQINMNTELINLNDKNIPHMLCEGLAIEKEEDRIKDCLVCSTPIILWQPHIKLCNSKSCRMQYDRAAALAQSPVESPSITRRSKKKRKVMYGKNDGTAMRHKSKHCRSLKLSKKDVLKIKLRMHCADRETDTEEA